jgi:NAD(P)H dehydrogenase (quinone)
MGGPAAQFKAFADTTVGRWLAQKWRDKLAAGFTVSGAPSGDELSTLQYFHTLAMQHGMIWAGTAELPMQSNGVNRLGSFIGVMALARSDEAVDTAPNAEDKLSAELLGKRIATLAAKWEPHKSLSIEAKARATSRASDTGKLAEIGANHERIGARFRETDVYSEDVG